MADQSITSDVFTGVKQAELQAFVYRCQHLPGCDDPALAKPCVNCKAFNYGTVAYTNNEDPQKARVWRVQMWFINVFERLLRRLGGQAAVDEFRDRLAQSN